MNSNLFRIVYCSRNRIHGSEPEVSAEIEKILLSSRANNSRQQVTGALLYNDGNFAQILEGSSGSVGKIFETIQCDPRHSEVTVVYSGPAGDRQFPDWSMAFAGEQLTDRQAMATAAFDAAFADKAGGGDGILVLLQDLVSQESNSILVN